VLAGTRLCGLRFIAILDMEGMPLFIFHRTSPRSY
jgi:hypothetical protein